MELRPAVTYASLIQQAIEASANQQCTLNDIYRWIQQRYPYYRNCKNNFWKNSIRHNLTALKYFVKVTRITDGFHKTTSWTLDRSQLPSTAASVRAAAAARGLYRPALPSSHRPRPSPVLLTAPAVRAPSAPCLVHPPSSSTADAIDLDGAIDAANDAGNDAAGNDAAGNDADNDEFIAATAFDHLFSVVDDADPAVRVNPSPSPTPNPNPAACVNWSSTLAPLQLPADLAYALGPAAGSPRYGASFLVLQSPRSPFSSSALHSASASLKCWNSRAVSACSKLWREYSCSACLKTSP